MDLEYKYFPNTLFAISHTSLAFVASKIIHNNFCNIKCYHLAQPALKCNINHNIRNIRQK
jgi:hypothetical protein